MGNKEKKDMVSISKRDKTLKEIFIGVCWEYLHDNFHKFSETNKIKIAMALAQKDLPTKMEGGLNVTQMDSVKIQNRLLEYSLDRANSSQDLGHPGETPSDCN